ncbi:hypothetical protein GCM10025770_07500 [Viridibacterium curvum]|uniref:Uncharacterized protein n=1 Tax=Viridibacterium curvum TaxID=1101404 RepID=A0ABP9QDK1_9RHOO
MSVAATDGSSVAAFREMVQAAGKKLSLNSGSGSQTPSTFPVPGAPHGGVPLYSSDDGGFVHLFNGFNKGYNATAEADLPPKIELVYVCRAYPTIRQENFHSGYGWPNYKFGNDGSAIVGIGNFVNTYTGGKGGFDELEVVVINEVYTNDASRTGEIFISDSRGDLISQGSFVDAASGSNFIRNAGIGSGGHGQNHDFFGMWYTLGRTLSASERLAVLAKLKTRYPIGKTPTKPHCRPSISWNSATQSFVVTLNYKPGTAGLPIDLAQTVIRWYLGDQLGSSTGNMLDKQSLFRTTDGNTLTLKRSDFPTQFPTPPSTNYLNVGVTVANTAGTKWREVCAFPFRDDQT